MSCIISDLFVKYLDLLLHYKRFLNISKCKCEQAEQSLSKILKSRQILWKAGNTGDGMLKLDCCKYNGLMR